MKTTIFLVNLVAVFIGVSYGMHGPILPVFAKNVIGATYTELGLIGLANFLPYMFIPIFVGILLDKYNNAHLLSVGILINSASLYLLSIAQTVPEVMVFRVMTGVAHAFFWPPCESIISSVSKGHARVKNIAKFTGFFVAGFTIGPLLGSLFLESFDVSYRLLFQFAAFILAAAIIASLSLSKKHIHKNDTKFSFSAIKEMRRFPEIIIMLVYCTASFGIILTIYPAFLDDNSISGVQIEILYFIFGVSRILTLLVAGKLARKMSHTLIAAVLSIAFGLLVSFGAGNIFEFAIAMLLMGFGFSIFFPLTLEIVLSKTKKTISGTIIGAYETTFGIGWTVGPIIAGILSQFQDNTAPYLVFFILGIGIAILSTIRRKSLEPQNLP